MKLLTHTLILTLCISLLSACGWRLRGSDSVNIQQNVYLAEGSGDIYQRIIRSLERKQARADITSADVQLVLDEEFFDRRSISVNNQAQTTQYQLTYSVGYQILDKASKPLTEMTRIELSRYYTFNQNAITSSDKEEQSLRKEMVRQLARQILQRVQFVASKSSQ